MIPPSVAYASHLSRALVSTLAGAFSICSPAMALIVLSSYSHRFCRDQEERICAYMARRIETEQPPLDRCSVSGLTSRRGRGGKIGGRNLAQQGAQARRALIAEGGCKLPLRLLPALVPRQQPFEAGVRQSQLLAPPVLSPRRDTDKAVALERQDVPAKRGPVHHHLFGQRVDRHRPLPSQPGEDGELGRAQARRGQIPIIKLRHMSRRLADSEAGAVPNRRQLIGRHHEFPVLDIRSMYA